MGGWARLRAAVFGIAGAALLMLFGCEQQKHPWGRDTKDSFGNGRFQILRSPTNIGRPELFLHDYEAHTQVVRFVKNWAVKSGYVFLVDANGKCWKVDYQTGAVASYEKADAAEAADRKVFEKLMK
jgi:hypothetical protein